MRTNNDRGEKESSTESELGPEKTKRKKPSRADLYLWQDNMIRLYNKWGIGDLNKLPKGGIGPDQLHLYPDNIRHTARNGRLSHLKTRYPTSALRLDPDAIMRKRAEVERTRKAKGRAQRDMVDAKKYAVVEKLPEGHQPYHAITERTSPWQYKDRRIHTSWESSTWGPAITNKEIVLGERRECHLPRYETLIIPRTVFEQGLLYDKINNRRRVGADGKWLRGKVTHMIFDRYYKLDEHEQRIPLPGPHYVYCKPHFTPAGPVAQVHSSDGAYTARRQAHPKFALVKHKDDALSDAEEEEYEDDHVLLPDVPGDSDGTPDSPDKPEDEDSEDDGDVFARTYREGSGLPYRPLRPIDELKSGGSDSGDPPDGGDGPPGGDPPPGSGGDDDIDSSEDDDDNGGVTKIKKRTFGIEGEKFTDDAKGKYRLVKCTKRYRCGFEFTQSDRVPALNPGAKKLYNDKGDRFTEVYPKNAPIPVRRKAEYKGVKWKMGKDGFFRKKDLKWRPVLILRKFNKDDGAYVGASDPFGQFPELINGNLPENLVRAYNKSILQYINRNDHEVGRPIIQPRWIDEEIREAVRFLNDLVRQHGLIQLFDQWDDIIHKAQKALDKYRIKQMNQPKRGPESVRTKFARSEGLQKKVKKAGDLKHRTDKISSAELKPEDHFTVKDFGVEATKFKAKKRTAGGKAKREAKAKTEGEFASENENGEESAGEGDDDDEPEVGSRPPKKKRK
ncbi:uncharacterized protein EKO05_0006097 [Ascochyta rabiei]|nr:uncharacterized protein EKO05_0006097 [Ascochyta rabiei]UPX15656.1 hypothetical protein EKO05_0006097 [Ascochyta rabiei]